MSGIRDRWGTAVGWLIVPLVVALQFVSLRRGVLVERVDLFSLGVLIFGFVALVTLPWTIASLRRLSAPAWLILGAFFALSLWASISVWLHPNPFLLGVEVPTLYLLMPIITAWLALLAGWGVAVAMPVESRLEQLWWASATIIVTSFIGWGLRMSDTGAARLSSGLGGAAVIYTVFLLAGTVFVVAAVRGHRTVLSVLGAVACVVAIILSGSRAGIASLVLLAGLIVISGSRRGRMNKRLWQALAAVAAVGSVLVIALPQLNRLFTLGDPLRASNLRTVLPLWSDSWSSMVFGRGWGQVWPWYMFEGGYFGQMPRLVWTPYGELLPHAHSTFLMALVELGVLGLLLLAALAAGLFWAFARLAQAGGTQRLLMLAAIMSVPAWLFDTYLFKNLPLALLWWFAVASVVTTNERTAVAQPSAAMAAS